MLLVPIVGDHGSGKTTFLGLTYATLVRSGSERADTLRFHAAYDSVEEISGLYERLMSGSFPDAATKEGARELRLQLDFPRGGLLSRFGARKSADAEATTVRFSVPGSLDDPTQGVTRGSTFGTGPWRDVLDADAVVFLVDSTTLTPKRKDANPGPGSPYDGRIDSLITSIRRWRARGGREVVRPVFVLSKFDLVPSEILQAAGVDPRPPPISKEGARAAYARALLGTHLAQTLATLEESSKGNPRFATARYFFSSVGRGADVPGEPHKIRLHRTDGGGWEPEYASEEYRAFLQALADIAAATKE